MEQVVEDPAVTNLKKMIMGVLHSASVDVVKSDTFNDVYSAWTGFIINQKIINQILRELQAKKK